jgi:phosphoserine/homoserine phosphotransferase
LPESLQFDLEFSRNLLNNLSANGQFGRYLRIVGCSPLKYNPALSCTRFFPSANQDEALNVACLDLEGVLTPEFWIAFAEHTGIDRLRDTTRDEPDYDVLMRQRLRLLRENGYGLADVQQVIGRLEPLPGAMDFLRWLRERFQTIIVSDTFYEFAMPLIRQLEYPTLLCHRLEVDAQGVITGYRLRQKDAKREVVRGFQALNYRVIAAGDSYNDTTMLAQADVGFLFDPPANLLSEFPQFPVLRGFNELSNAFAASAWDFDGPN